MTTFKQKLLCSLICALPLQAIAEEAATPPAAGLYHIYMGALYSHTDNNRDLVKYGRGFTGALGIPLNFLPGLHLELGGSTQTLVTDDSLATNFFRHEVTGSLMYSFGDRDHLTPFVRAGIGMVRLDTDIENTNDFTAHIGAGLTHLLWNGVRGRAELRGVYDESDPDSVFDGVISVGVEVPLGRKEIVEVKSAPETIERQVEVIKEVEVVKEVVPADSDGDRIADTDDKCPGTLAGIRTDNTGCAIAQSITLGNIQFETNKAVLTDASMETIRSAASFFAQQPNLRAIIAGHTDDVGADKHNLRLSQARAEAVVRALATEGLDASRFRPVGLGESMPAVANDSVENRALNRRVEFMLSTGASGAASN